MWGAKAAVNKVVVEALFETGRGTHDNDCGAVTIEAAAVGRQKAAP